MALHVMHLIGGGEIGGAEHNVLNLLRSSTAKESNVYLGCLVKNSPFADLASKHNIQTVTFPMLFSLDISPLWRVIKFCQKNHIDIIHCHGTRANFIGRLAAKLSGIPCISTVHSLPEFDYLSATKGRFALWLDNLTLSICSGFIAVSASLRESVSLRFKKKGLNPPLKTIYNGIHPLEFPSREQIRHDFKNDWCIPDDCKVIGTIGRLHPVKGHQYLIEAFKVLIKEFPNLHLVIIGSGPLHEQLEDLLISSDLPYTITGYIPNAWRCIPAMDVFVLPSLSEGMGIVLLEAAQGGVPIVASRVGGIPELFRDHEEALLARPADPIDIAISCSKILKDQAFTERLVTQARERASLFTSDKMVNETSEFYQQIIGEHQA